MTLCEDGHPEIVHNEGWKSCPLCDANNEKIKMEEEIAELNDKISDLQDEIIELNNKK